MNNHPELYALRDALKGLLDHYVRHANSGDAGNWDPEEEPEVIKARSALLLQMQGEVPQPSHSVVIGIFDDPGSTEIVANVRIIEKGICDPSRVNETKALVLWRLARVLNCPLSRLVVIEEVRR